MTESVEYQANLEESEYVSYERAYAEGFVEGHKLVILRAGVRRLDQPSTAIIAEIEKIKSADRLLELADKLLFAISWDDLLLAHVS